VQWVRRIVRKSGIVAAQPETVDFSPLVEDEAFELAYQISRLPYAVKACVESVEPCVLIAYMINLCHAISSANNVLRVKDMNQKLAQPRLLLFDAARTALAVTIRLLGLKPLEQM
jgi:arginyl-tRNA synthetase